MRNIGINLEDRIDCTEWPLDITQKVFFKLLNTYLYLLYVNQFASIIKAKDNKKNEVLAFL